MFVLHRAFRSRTGEKSFDEVHTGRDSNGEGPGHQRDSIFGTERELLPLRGRERTDESAREQLGLQRAL